MGKCIIKIQDKYFVWSSIVDAPVTYGMSLDELHEYIKDEYGNVGLRQLPAQLDLVDKNGHSARSMTLAELLAKNRAGEEESCLTIEEIYNVFTSHKGSNPPLKEENL